MQRFRYCVAHPLTGRYIFRGSPLETELSIEGSVTESKSRKELIPLWIKIFGWLFLVLGVVAPILYVASAIFDFEATYEMFGLSYTGSAYAAMPMLISFIILVNGLCAYGLLFQKDWGLMSCLVMGYIGLLITLVSMFIYLPDLTIRLEPLLQIPYLVKLHKMKPQW